MPDGATECVAKHSSKLQPSITLHAPPIMFGCSGTQCTGMLTDRMIHVWRSKWHNILAPSRESNLGDRNQNYRDNKNNIYSHIIHTRRYQPRPSCPWHCCLPINVAPCCTLLHLVAPCCTLLHLVGSPIGAPIDGPRCGWPPIETPGAVGPIHASHAVESDTQVAATHITRAKLYI